MARPLRSALMSALLVGAMVGAMVGSPSASAAESSPSPACIQSRAEARYLGFAYDHFVHIHNTCDKSADCTVSTNVNPDPIDVTVPAGEARSVLTYRANPSRVFTYDLRCKLTD